MLVNKPINFSRTSATYAPTIPITTAKRLIVRSRGVAVKSPSPSAMSRSLSGIAGSDPLEVRRRYAIVIEEHPGPLSGRLDSADDLTEEHRELALGARRQLLDRANQPVLDGVRRGDSSQTAAWREDKLELARVSGRPLPCDEAALNEARNDRP